jgi:hypothetical protein
VLDILARELHLEEFQHQRELVMGDLAHPRRRVCSNRE